MGEASLICRPFGLDPTFLEARILPGPLFLVPPQPQLLNPPGRPAETTTNQGPQFLNSKTKKKTSTGCAQHTPPSSIHGFQAISKILWWRRRHQKRGIFLERAEQPTETSNLQAHLHLENTHWSVPHNGLAPGVQRVSPGACRTNFKGTCPSTWNSTQKTGTGKWWINMRVIACMNIEQGDNDFQTRIYLIFDLQGYHSGYMSVFQDTLPSKSNFTARILAMVAALSLSFGGRKHKEGLLDWNALPSLKLAVRTWKLVVGRWFISFWDGLFSVHEGLQNSWKATIKGTFKESWNALDWSFF